MRSIKYSNVKVFWHQEKIKAIAENRLTPPVYIRIKPTNTCNHSCFYCSYQNDKRLITAKDLNTHDTIPREKMMEILNDLKDMGVKAVTYSGGGEPLIYPHIEETLAKTLEYNIDLAIITNGQKLNEKRAELLSYAKWVRISMDTSNAQTFSKIRKVPGELFAEIEDNIRKFAKLKNPKCELGINFVINHQNCDEVYDSAKFYRDLGVNHVKFTARNTPDFHKYHAPFKDQTLDQIHRATKDFVTDGFVVHNSYEQDFTFAGVYQRSYKICPIIQIVTIIGADCAVYLCHDNTYSKRGMVTSIKDKSFKEMWLSDETKELLQNFDASKECCHHCTYDQRNILINEIIACKDDHVNFI